MFYVFTIDIIFDVLYDSRLRSDRWNNKDDDDDGDGGVCTFCLHFEFEYEVL